MGIRGIDRYIYIYIHTTIPHVYRWLNQLSYKKGHHISLLWLVESWFLKVKPINPAKSTIFAGEIPISLNWILFFVGSTLKNPPFFLSKIHHFWRLGSRLLGRFHHPLGAGHDSHGRRAALRLHRRRGAQRNRWRWGGRLLVLRGVAGGDQDTWRCWNGWSV